MYQEQLKFHVFFFFFKDWERTPSNELTNRIEALALLGTQSSQQEARETKIRLFEVGRTLEVRMERRIMWRMNLIIYFSFEI